MTEISLISLGHDREMTLSLAGSRGHDGFRNMYSVTRHAFETQKNRKFHLNVMWYKTVGMPMVAIRNYSVVACCLFVFTARVVLGQGNDDARRIAIKEIGLSGNVLNATSRYHSGYFRLERTYDAHMFFFLFEPRDHRKENSPIVLWMTGGPGCSSEMAIFYENGPWKLERGQDGEIQLKEREYSWDSSATMIFVDQPINTGFSYSENPDDRCYDEACVSKDMVDFLAALLDARPDFKGRDFFVTGESYAGHYVPAVAFEVFQASRGMDSERRLDISLKGLAIGNGLTNPAIQYGAYPEFAFQHGLIDEMSKNEMMSIYPACKYALETCDTYSIAIECYVAVQFCQATMFSPILVENPDINVYDFRKTCEGDLCYDFSLLEEYLNQDHVKEMFGVQKNMVWEECNMQVHEDMMADWGHRFDIELPEMMEAGVRVMIYAGDKDIICNELGNRQWVDALQWKGSEAWKTAKNAVWRLDSGEDAGIVKEVGPLSFVSVKGAGHMVPMDQPKAALEMITKFLNDQKLSKQSESFWNRIVGLSQRYLYKTTFVAAH